MKKEKKESELKKEKKKKRKKEKQNFKNYNKRVMTTIQLSLSYEFITSHTGDLQLRRNSFYYRIIYCHLHTY